MKVMILRSLFTVFIAIPGIFVCAAAEPAVLQKTENSNKEAGDRAFSSRSFDTAAEFYRTYRQEAESRQDLPALRDAFECEINSLIFAARASQAEELLKLYLEKFPDADRFSISLWTADILLLKRQAEEAEKTVSSVLPDLPKQDPRRVRALMALAAAAEIQRNYAAAAAAYSRLLENSSDTPFMRKIGERRILVLTALGNTEEAVELLAKLKLDEDERSIEAYRLLNIYLSLKNKAETDPFEEEKSIESLRTDNFFYLISSLIGDEYAAVQKYTSALAAYRLAYFYARTTPDAFDAMNRMIAMFEKMGRKEEAGALAATQMDLFLRPHTSMLIKFAVIRLLASTGREKETLQLAESCLNMAGQDRETTFRTLFRMMTGNKVLDYAEKLIDLYLGGKPETDFSLSCRAEIRILRNDRKTAAELYRKAAEKGNFLRNGKKAVELYSALGEYDTVIELAGTLLKQGQDANLLFHRAVAYETTKKRELATQDYLQCEKLTKNSALAMQAAFRAAVLYFSDRKIDTAEKIFRRIFESEDKLAASAGYWLTLCAYCNRDEMQAEKQAQLLAKRFPDSRYSGLALLKVADYYMNYGLPDKAKKLLGGISGKNTKLPQTIQTQALYRSAVLAYRKNQQDEAMTFLRKILKEYPENTDNLADVYYLAGDILRSRNQFAEAAESYRKAAELRPETRLAQAAAGSEGDCLFALAAKNDKAGEFRSALAVYMKLLEQKNLLPEYQVMTWYKAGRCHQLLGESEKAAALYEKMLYYLPAQDLQSRPVERYWILKGMDAFELIAMKNSDAGLINKAVDAMNMLLNANAAPDKNDYKTRIKTLKKQKRKITATKATGVTEK